jgi:predicted Ser/Thr protein kinase
MSSDIHVELPYNKRYGGQIKVVRVPYRVFYTEETQIYCRELHVINLSAQNVSLTCR